jgi:hypothetical protein
MRRRGDPLAPGFVSPCQRPVPSGQDETLGSKAGRVKSDRARIGSDPAAGSAHWIGPPRTAQVGALPTAARTQTWPRKNNSRRLQADPGGGSPESPEDAGRPASGWKFSRNLSCVTAPAGGADPAAVTRVTWITPVTGVARDGGAAENCQVRAARGAGHQESSAFPAETRPDRCQTDTCAF